MEERPAEKPFAPKPVFREQVCDKDVEAIQSLVEATGFFSPQEVLIAAELVEERLAKGEKSGYHFIFAQDPSGKVLGYACFGPVPGTRSSFDLYWIAVDRICQGRGIGRNLIERAERAAVEKGCSRIYAETSSRRLYEPTRRFYQSCGYREEALLEDFYAPGDSKIIFVKTLS